MPSLSPYESLIEKAGKEFIPLSCVFEITYKCNLNCIHCYIVKRKKREVTKSQAVKIIGQLEKAGCLFLTFSGGEIFLRKDFFEIADYAKNKKFAIKLFSNGTLIDSDIADKIKQISPIGVEISLYGFKDTHEKITQSKGSFEKTVKAIKLLKERKINVSVKSVVMRQNVDKFFQLNRFVQELGAQMRGSLFISPTDDGGMKPLSYRLSDAQLKRHVLVEMKIAGDKYNYKKGRLRDDFLCKAGNATVNINPYLQVNPCLQIRLNNNSLRNKSFIEIWRHHEDFLKIREMRLSDRVACKGCNLISHCSVCPGLALLEEGSLIKPLKESCRVAKIKKSIYENL